MVCGPVGSGSFVTWLVTLAQGRSWRGSGDPGFGRGPLLLAAQWNNLPQSLEAVHIPCFIVASL